MEFLIFTTVRTKERQEFYKKCFFSEKTKQKKRKHVTSKRCKFEDFTYEVKKQKTSNSEDELFTATPPEGSLTQELS